MWDFVIQKETGNFQEAVMGWASIFILNFWGMEKELFKNMCALAKLKIEDVEWKKNWKMMFPETFKLFLTVIIKVRQLNWSKQNNKCWQMGSFDLVSKCVSHILNWC